MADVVHELRSTSPEATRRIGGALAELLVAGDVVALSGELGAGKTCFVQGVAAALGVADRVTSPTFVLVRTYTGRLPLVHCDVYRLERLGDLDDLGDDVLAGDVVTLIEWGDAVRALLPDDRLEVEIRHHDDADADASGPDADASGPDGDARGPDGDARGTDGDARGTDGDARGTDDGGGGDGDRDADQRRIAVRAYGGRWAERSVALDAACADYR